MNQKTYEKQDFLVEFEESVKEMKKLCSTKRDEKEASSWRNMLEDKE